MVKSAEQIGIATPLKWEYVLNAVNQNYPIEHAHTVATIKDAMSFRFNQVKLFP